MNSGFNQNQSEFTVFIGSLGLDMLSDVNSFLDKMVKIFWDGWSNSVNLQNSENFLSGDATDLGDTVLISEEDTNLRWG